MNEGRVVMEKLIEQIKNEKLAEIRAVEMDCCAEVT